MDESLETRLREGVLKSLKTQGLEVDPKVMDALVHVADNILGPVVRAERRSRAESVVDPQKVAAEAQSDEPAPPKRREWGS